MCLSNTKVEQKVRGLNMTKEKMNLSRFIASQRERLGNISQVELSKKCGVPAGTIASIESGYAKSPRPITLKKLAEGLAVPPDIIFKLASNPEKEMAVDLEELQSFQISYFGKIPSNSHFKVNEDSAEKLPFPVEFINEGDFVVSLAEDSLTDEDIYEGDFIVISQQDYLKRSGDLMLCTIENETTLRRVYKEKNNFKIKEKTYSPEEVTFWGKACLSISKRKL